MPTGAYRPRRARASRSLRRGPTPHNARADEGPRCTGSTDATFALLPAGSICVVVESPSPGGEIAATSARIDLDGETIIGPSHFSHHPSRLEQRRSVTAGNHLVAAEIRSTPGATLRVEVRYAADRGPEIIAQMQELDALELAQCEELNRVLESLSPGAASGLVADAEELGLQLGRIVLDYNSYEVPSRMAPLPAENLGLPIDATPETRALAWLDRHRAVFRWTDRGLVATQFQGRTQLFVRRDAPTGHLSHQTFAVSGPPSEAVTLRGHWRRRLVAFQLDAPTTPVPVQVLLTVDFDQSPVYYLSRSG